MKKVIFNILGILLLFAAQSPAATALFIGDSHSVGPFGWKLDELLRGVPGTSVASYASCGSIALWWETGKPTPCGYYFRDTGGKINKGLKAPTPYFDVLLDEVKPDLVVVELGANYSNIPSDDFAVNDMKKLAKKIADSGSACFWITQPDSRKGKDQIQRILELTRKAVTPYCSYFDSTKVTGYPSEGGDGIHYWFQEGLPIANAWAEAAFASIKPLLDKLPVATK